MTPMWHSSEMAIRGHLNDFKFLSAVLTIVARKAEAFCFEEWGRSRMSR